MPTCGGPFKSTAAADSSELLWIFVSESVPGSVALFLSTLSELDASILGSDTDCLMMGTPGLRFFFSKTFLKGLLLGTTLVALKCSCFLGNMDFPIGLGLVPFIENILLTRGLVLAIIIGVEESLSWTSELALLTSSVFSCWSNICPSADGFKSWCMLLTSWLGAREAWVVKVDSLEIYGGEAAVGNIFPKDVKGVSIWIKC